jgi:hypothetical protein
LRSHFFFHLLPFQSLISLVWVIHNWSPASVATIFGYDKLGGTAGRVLTLFFYQN